MDATTHSRHRELLQLAADPRRWRILGLLHSRGRTVTELVSELGIAQPAVSHHLARLLEAGLVCVRAAGRSRVYSWSTPPAATPEAELQRMLRRWLGASPVLPEPPRGGLRGDIEIHLL